jgi:hypothetical protein
LLRFSAAQLRAWLTRCVAFTCLYVGIQYYWLHNRGAIPFLAYYDLSRDYASVREKATTIILYNQRVFGFFAEASILAASLIFFCVCILLLSRRLGELRKIDNFWIAMALLCIVLAKSGMATFSLPLLLILWASVAAPKTETKLLLAIPGLAAGYIGVTSVLNFRNKGTSLNDSWSERLSSITAVFSGQAHSLKSMLFGFGSGQIPELFATGFLPITYDMSTKIPLDVYSIFVKFIGEYGYPVGLLLIFAPILVLSKRMWHSINWLWAVVFAALWLLVGGLSVAYISTPIFWLTLSIAWRACVLEKEVVHNV